MATESKNEGMDVVATTSQFITSKHKKLYLRFVTAHTNFLNDPEKFPEYLSILINDLNALGIFRDKEEWLRTLQSWVAIIEAETKDAEDEINTNLSAEDEQLQEHLRQTKNWVEPTYAELSCIVDHLEEVGDLPSLWKVVADKFRRMNPIHPNDFEYWRRVYYHITRTILAKKDLIDYIETNHSYVKFQTPQMCALSKLEIRVLRLQPQLNIRFNINTNYESIATHCRICLASSSSAMTYLFGRKIGDAITILEKLHYCACMNSYPSKGDGFPEYICTSCSVLLESAYQLKMLCSKTESKLLGVIVDVDSTEEEKTDKSAAVDEMYDDVGGDDNYKQIEIIDTMELSDDDGSKNIYLVTSDDIGDGEEQSEVITYEINQESTEEIHTELYEIDDEGQDNQPVETITDKGVATPNVDSSSHEFQCDACGLAFKNLTTLKVHLKSHSLRRHECNDCKKNFKTRLSLTIHRRSHTNERPYVCETCGKAFKTVSAVNNHRAIHSEVKEFNCPQCPYRASTKANLKIHDRTHSKIQPYSCRYCVMKFSTASNMHKHIRNIHEKLKTNKCDQCDRTFFTRESARKHMVTHTGLKPYTCTQCPMAYGWYNGLKKHVKMQHANIKIPTETSFFNRLKKS